MWQFIIIEDHYNANINIRGFALHRILQSVKNFLTIIFTVYNQRFVGFMKNCIKFIYYCMCKTHFLLAFLCEIQSYVVFFYTGILWQREGLVFYPWSPQKFLLRNLSRMEKGTRYYVCYFYFCVFNLFTNNYIGDKMVCCLGWLFFSQPCLKSTWSCQ